jgi:RsiW-degrading membrane proteinase PrsW (M82 family)
MAATAPPAQGPAPVRPSWGYHVSLWQWRRPAFWFYAVIMAGSLIASLILQLNFVGLSPVGWLLSWFLLLIYAVPVFIFVYVLDLYEREPLSLVFGALLWGGFAAVALSLLAQTGWDSVISSLLGQNATEWSSAVSAPITEEVTKGAGVIFIYLIAREEMDDIMDGFVYGAMAGLGFTVIEDIFYFVGVFGGTPGGVLEGFFFRVIGGGLYGHPLYTGLFGIGVAYFVSRRREATTGQRILVAGGLIFLSMFAHFLWNSPLLYFYPETLSSVGDYLQVIFATAVKGMPFLAFLILMIVLARRREHRWLRAALQSEVGLQGLHHDELVTLEHPKLRRAAVKRMRANSGPVAADTLKRLQKAHIDLAMIRSRVDEDDHPDLVRQRAYIESLRNWLVQATGHRGSTLAWNIPVQPGAQPPPAGQPPQA